MFGFRFLKVPPTTYVLHYKGEQVAKEGAGLSFFYFAPTATIVQVPLGSIDVPFVFTEVTSDFQEATIQGQLTYRISNPKQASKLLDFSLDPNGRYHSDDNTKLGERLTHAAQILARSFTQKKELRALLISSDALVSEIQAGLKTSEAVQMLGVEVLALAILSIKANPQMTKAFEAGSREEVLRRADEAIYARRNASVELERTIKENELNTEIAIEQKQRQVRETQMAAAIAVESQRTQLVETQVANQRKEAETRAFALTKILEPVRGLDWRMLLAANAGLDPKFLVALGFQELAANASKIGQLNVSPDLLSTLLRPQEE